MPNLKEKNTITVDSSKIENIDVSKLIPTPYNNFETDNVGDLALDIKENGLKVPLTVCGPFDDGTYSVLSGCKRLKALKSLVAEGEKKFEIVPCIITGNKDMPVYEQQLIIEASNLETTEFNECDRLKAIEKIKEKINE